MFLPSKNPMMKWLSKENHQDLAGILLEMKQQLDQIPLDKGIAMRNVQFSKKVDVRVASKA